MKRVFFTAVFVLVFGAVWQALANALPQWLNLFFFPPVIIVFSLQYFKPLETIFIALICGLMADIFGGFLIGSNMLLMLLLAFIMGALNLFSGRIYRQELFYYVMAVSFVYRLILLIVHLVFLGSKTNVFIAQLIMGPIIDGLVSFIFYHLLVKMLSLMKTFDPADYFRNRIGSRS